MKLVSENSVRFKASSIVQTDTIRMFQSCRTDYTGFRLSRRTTYKSIHFLMHQSHSRPIIKKDPFITTRHTDTVSVGRFVSGFSLVPRLPYVRTGNETSQRTCTGTYSYWKLPNMSLVKNGTPESIHNTL